MKLIEKSDHIEYYSSHFNFPKHSHMRYLNQHLKKIDLLAKKSRFFESKIVTTLLEIKKNIAEKNEDEVLHFLDQKKLQLSGYSNLYPSKSKAIKALEHCISDINGTLAKNENSRNSFCTLPKEMLLTILSFLNSKQLATMSQVCHAVYKLISESTLNPPAPKLSTHVQKLLFTPNIKDTSSVMDICVFRYVVATLHKNGKVHFYNRETGNYLYFLQHAHPINAITKLHNSLLIGDNEGFVCAWDVQHKIFTKNVKLFSNPIKELLHVDEHTLFMTVGTKKNDRFNHHKQLHVIDSDLLVTKSVTLSHSIDLICLTDENLFCVTRDKKLSQWDTKTMSSIAEWDIAYQSPPKQILAYQDKIVMRYLNNAVCIKDTTSQSYSWLNQEQAPLGGMTLLDSHLILGFGNGMVSVFELKRMKLLPNITTQANISTIRTASTNQLYLGEKEGRYCKLNLTELDYDCTEDSTPKMV